MGESKTGKLIFPLTGLQIGDLQSYLSFLSLFLAPESKKFYVLVDNQPWLKDPGSKPAHLWQFMVTKSRLSPFANRKARKERKNRGETPELKTSSKSTGTFKKYKKWFSLVDAAALSQKRAMLPVKKLRNTLILNSKLHRTLYGYIVFEVAWADVRGINYLNELQTDTSLAIEAKFMKRWEFESIAQAANCISSWFPGTNNERLLLKEYLHSATGDVFLDSQENFPINDDVSTPNNSTSMEEETDGLHTPPPSDVPYKRRKITKFSISDSYPEETNEEIVGSPMHSPTSYTSDCEDLAETTNYSDVLILFRFNDCELPVKLREIITSDLRLLTLLESGLPSWVVFVQSYPVFCHLYRPWMCPLARALYVMVSVVTVLIGFYDLYKNVPVLKVTASRICGPLFDWIETWEMITRIKYLGTMLFLHNCQKAVKWFMMITHTSRSFLSIIAQPMAEPLVEFIEFFLPCWSICMQIVESICSIIWTVVGSSWNLVEDIVEMFFLPIWFMISLTWSFAMSVIYPIFWILWELLYAPVRVVLGLSNILVFICVSIYDVVGDIWLFASSIFQLTSTAEVTATAYEVSMWRSLWNDLFSQIFRAVRSILNGFVAFFTACNRHRLSIYNHSQEFIQRLAHPAQRLRKPDYPRQRGRPTHLQNLLMDNGEGREENPDKMTLQFLLKKQS